MWYSVHNNVQSFPVVGFHRSNFRKCSFAHIYWHILVVPKGTAEHLQHSQRVVDHTPEEKKAYSKAVVRATNIRVQAYHL